MNMIDRDTIDYICEMFTVLNKADQKLAVNDDLDEAYKDGMLSGEDEWLRILYCLQESAVDPEATWSGVAKVIDVDRALFDDTESRDEFLARFPGRRIRVTYEVL